MKSIVSKSKTKPGIKIISIPRKCDCDLELIIPAQFITCKRSLIVKEYPIFTLEMKFTCKSETYPNGLHFKFEKLPYSKDENGNIRLEKDNSIKINISDKDYSGSLIVYRTGYMDSNLLGKLRKERTK